MYLSVSVVVAAIAVFHFSPTADASSPVTLQYHITTTWDGSPTTPRIPASLALTPTDDGLVVAVQAKFWNDPARPPGGKVGKPYFRLWDYEVVELFLLNDAGQYLELELNPWGQHLVLLLDSGRDLRHSLPLDFVVSDASVPGSSWSGTAVIPTNYLPPNITKLNAFAIHGSGSSRQYLALYPAPPGIHEAPNFHRLEYFRSVANLPSPTQLSPLWSLAMEGKQEHSIEGTWEGKAIDHPPAVITLEPGEGHLILRVKAPFFNDPSPPGGKPGEAFFKLWDYEVVEAFFLNKDEQYLELEFGPHGQHLMLLLNGTRNAVKHSLPLEYTATIDKTRGTWEGVAKIPSQYFPPDVTLFNAYAIHGTGDDRIYEALYESSGPQPDFHRLEKFQPIDFKYLLPDNRDSPLSDAWTQAIAESDKASPSLTQRYTISRTWDDKPLDHSPATVSLSPGNGHVVVNIEAPYFSDPAPPGGKQGEAFFKLWDYEVVEAFFLNKDDQYLELEFGPHGQHLMLILNGNRNAIKHSLPLEYTAKINLDSGTWEGVAKIPSDYFPPNITLFNAYAIHGTGDDRVYEALYEVSGPQPDFHRLHKFQPIGMGDILPGNDEAHLSDLWKQAIVEDKMMKQ